MARVGFDYDTESSGTSRITVSLLSTLKDNDLRSIIAIYF